MERQGPFPSSSLRRTAPACYLLLSYKISGTELQICFADLYANKAGVKPPKLRVVSNDQEFNFVFTAEEPMCTLNRDSFRDQVKSLIREGMAQPGSAELGDVTMDMGTPDVCRVSTLTIIVVSLL
jgi:hypothetical protein